MVASFVVSYFDTSEYFAHGNLAKRYVFGARLTYKISKCKNFFIIKLMCWSHEY